MKQKIINKFPFDLLLENGSVQTRQNVSSSSLEEETVFFGFFADLFFFRCGLVPFLYADSQRKILARYFLLLAPPRILSGNTVFCSYPRRARSALGVDIVFTLDVCLYVSALERKRLIGMT